MTGFAGPCQMLQRFPDLYFSKHYKEFLGIPRYSFVTDKSQLRLEKQNSVLQDHRLSKEVEGSGFIIQDFLFTIFSVGKNIGFRHLHCLWNTHL